MSSPLRSPKTLSEWFELDYFRRRRLFRGLWKSLTWGALLAASFGVAWTLLSGNQSVYQAGPLSTSHAMFNGECGICHTEKFRTLKRLLTGDTAVRSVPDSACKQCHDGPRHHECAAQQSCVGCHHEHRGQTALASVTDNQSTSCHADLRCDNGAPSVFDAYVTSFERRHPEFRLFREGKPDGASPLRFNHKVHLQGLLGIDHKQMETQREKLREAGVTLCDQELPQKEVLLECNACHQQDAAGRYMLPVNFDRHCKDCHPLSVQLVGEWQGPLKERACEFSKSPAPHPAAGETATVVRAALRERLTRFILSPMNKAFLGGAEPGEPERPLVGWIRGEPVQAREFAWVNRQLEQVEHVLFDGGGGCGKCHQEKTAPHERPSGLPAYEWPDVKGPDRPWFEHSVFSHDKHKMLDCKECHADARESTTARVELPGIKNCQQCHHDGTPGGARADCAECHVYHDQKLKREFRGDQRIGQLLAK
jgi:hypothetical protein